jgi:periplasmic mercuric ion binding protein
MNMTKSLLAIVFAGALFVGCKDAAKAPNQIAENATAKTEAVAGKTETASFNIEGMSCAVMCANKIEKQLAGMDGVTKASVDFEKKSATVEYDSAKQSPEKIADAVEAIAGGDTYKVINMKSSQDHASLFNKEKKKKKKAKTEEKKDETKKEGCATETKGGCCAGKKPASCHSM